MDICEEGEGSMQVDQVFLVTSRNIGNFHIHGAEKGYSVADAVDGRLQCRLRCGMTSSEAVTRQFSRRSGCGNTSWPILANTRISGFEKGGFQIHAGRRGRRVRNVKLGVKSSFDGAFSC